MFTDMQTGRPRDVNAKLNRQVLPFIQPYLSRLENWNKRAAQLTALMLSRRATPEAVGQRLAELEELAADVDASFAEFEEVVATLPSHSRVDDLRAAFRRLQAMLHKVGAPMPFD
jgi:site-specific recombinase